MAKPYLLNYLNIFGLFTIYIYSLLEFNTHQLNDREVLDILSLSENATAIYTSADIRIQYANDAMIAFWGKDRSVVGKTFLEAIPELRGQPFNGLLQEVWSTGVTYYGEDTPAELRVDGKLQTFYYTFTYRAIKNAANEVMCILHTAEDVTTRVMGDMKILELNEELTSLNEELYAANEELSSSIEEYSAINEELYQTVSELNITRNDLEATNFDLFKAEETLRFAINSAGIATWFMDMDKRDFTPSVQLKAMFGYSATQNLSLEKVTELVDEEDRNFVVEAVEAAIAAGDSYDLEFRIHNVNAEKITWVKSFGKCYPDPDGKLNQISGIFMDITERKNDELRKNDFIGMVSHELKTPLTSLSGYVQLMQIKAEKNGDQFGSGAMGKASNQISKMKNMINGFLNISRLESGKIHLDKQKFNLDDLVREMIKDVEFSSSTHVILLDECDALEVNADKDKIGNVILNLLSNAIKYSPTGTAITLICSVNDTSAQLAVTDQGHGMNQTDLLHVFERFYRIESKENQSISGFGIGLYLSKEIIERHDGKMWVESEPGKGSTFYFSLPL